MKTTVLERKFKFKDGNKDVETRDPNPNITPDAVLELFSGQYPELTNATVKGPKIENDVAIYEFVTTVGTKG